MSQTPPAMTPEAIVRTAVEEGLCVVSTTDHYEFTNVTALCAGRVGDDRPSQSAVTWLLLGCAGFHRSTFAGRRELQKSFEQIVTTSYTELVVDQNDAVLDDLARCTELSRNFLTLHTVQQQARYLFLLLRQ